MPKTNSAFWIEKLDKNRARDNQNCKELVEMGIQVVVVWECTVDKMIKSPAIKDKTINAIIDAITTGEFMYYEI